MAAPLLAIENLRVVFHGDRGRRTVAVDGVDLSLARGSTLDSSASPAAARA